MRERTSITPDEEKWLISIGWKKHTLSQLVEILDCSPTPIKRILDKHDLMPPTKRDLIAKEILIKYGTEIRLNTHELGLEFNVSDRLIKEILMEYGINLISKQSPEAVYKIIKAFPSMKVKETGFSEDWLDRLKRKEERSKEIKAARAGFTFYTQTGTDTLDDIRGVKTTKRV